MAACSGCGCSDPVGATAHAVNAKLLVADLDRAIEAGLLSSVDCAGCSNECRASLRAARNERLTALAARERYRARNARLQRRATDLAARRAPAPSVEACVPAATPGADAIGDAVPAAVTTPTGIPGLPAAAAAALARAQARAAQRRNP